MIDYQNSNTATGNDVGISSYTSSELHAVPPESDEADEATGVMETIDWLSPCAAGSLVIASKHDQSALVRTIGERLREARELNNLSQSEAAKRLGYSNPSKLSKVESATDTNSVPLWLIVGAARVSAPRLRRCLRIPDSSHRGRCPRAQVRNHRWRLRIRPAPASGQQGNPLR